MHSVWLFEWCDSIYESAYEARSAHIKKKNAYKAMKREVYRMWHFERDMMLMYGNYRKHAPLSHQAWRIRNIEIEQ